MLTKAERAAISAAISQAESQTAGEIVCVLARASSDYAHVSGLWAAFAALVSPWIALALTHWSVERILALQIVVFIVCGWVFSWPAVRRALTPRAIQRTRAYRAAIEQFHARGLTQSPNRMGVMIFVSLAEHYARIIADDGVAERVDQKEWQQAVDMLVAHAREERIGAGFVAAIERCGAILARHAPPDGTGDTLPNRIYVI